MSDKGTHPIIVKRSINAPAAHHGGAWKLAYADFMTAMMAFFLLMWLLGSVNHNELAGIAQYFRTPLKVAIMGGKRAADSAGVIDGGGPDMTRSQGQIAHGANPPPPTRSAASGQRNEAEQLRRLKARLLQAIESNPALNQFRKQLLIDITKEGLRIQIVDTQNRPMFANGSARVEPYMRDILHEIGKALNDVPNRISLSGHTDATRYATGDKDYSNWELSADRANASRRELIAGGMDADKVVRVQGLASTLNLDKENPADPINRRISIIVLNHQAEAALERENDAATVDAPDQKGAAQSAVQAAARAADTAAVPKR